VWLGLHIQMGPSRWFECEEQIGFIMLHHDCLYFASGSFSKMHTQRPRVRSSRTHTCNDPSGGKLRCDTPPRHECKSKFSQLVKADLAKSSAGILSGSRSVRHGVRTVSNQLFRLANSQLAKADLEKSSAGISSGFRSSQQ